MTIYNWLILSGFLFFLAYFISIFFIELILRKRKDYSLGKGSVKSGILYSFTKGMSPAKKESAYLHLPTYVAGMIFHIGTFLCFFLLALFFFNIYEGFWLKFLLSLIISASILCGFSIFVKRIINSNLRLMSNLEDYFSNLLVTGFQILTLITLFRISIVPALFIYGTLLFFYIPAGKLKHTIYFFISRINLGIYYGKRKVWPVKEQKL